MLHVWHWIKIFYMLYQASAKTYPAGIWAMQGYVREGRISRPWTLIVLTDQRISIRETEMGAARHQDRELQVSSCPPTVPT